eukprot:COSAG02_NODE_1842_length_10700_cov_148.785869_1_plen_143_part_10
MSRARLRADRPGDARGLRSRHLAVRNGALGTHHACLYVLLVARVTALLLAAMDAKESGRDVEAEYMTVKVMDGLEHQVDEVQAGPGRGVLAVATGARSRVCRTILDPPTTTRDNEEVRPMLLVSRILTSRRNRRLRGTIDSQT